MGSLWGWWKRRDTSKSQVSVLQAIAKGNALMRSGQYDTARSAFENGLALARDTGQRTGICLCLVGIASAFEASNKYGDALKYYEEALTAARENDDSQTAKMIMTRTKELANRM